MISKLGWIRYRWMGGHRTAALSGIAVIVAETLLQHQSNVGFGDATTPHRSTPTGSSGPGATVVTGITPDRELWAGFA